jgi:hypothetical protein
MNPCARCDFAFSAGGVRRLTATVTAGNELAKSAAENRFPAGG